MPRRSPATSPAQYLAALRNCCFSSKALLRQAGGFVGFGWFREEAGVEHLAPPHPLNSGNRDVDVNAAPPPASPEPANSNNLLSGFSRLLDLEAHVFKVLGQLGHKSHEPVMAQVGLALQLSPQGNELRLLVPEGQVGLAGNFPSQECVEGVE